MPDSVSKCESCGYDLRGHGVDAARCPECGFDISANGARTPRLLRRAWLAPPIIAMLLLVILMGFFHIALVSEGLTTIDLWRDATPLEGTPAPGAKEFAKVGRRIATLCTALSGLLLIYCMNLMLFAVIRSDILAAMIGMVGFFVAFYIGYEALELGGRIAGL
jgi:hypothetical protein